jgi:UDP-N-acetylglucosamine 2-epimerase
MATARNPYGDGHAADQILDRMRRYFSGDTATSATSPALQPALMELVK